MHGLRCCINVTLGCFCHIFVKKTFDLILKRFKTIRVKRLWRMSHFRHIKPTGYDFFVEGKPKTLIWRKRMKKLLIATTAIAGLATVATPAMAQSLELDLGGFYRGYGVFADSDATADTRDFDLRHDAEIHFTGETTLNNGLTVGVHAETELAADANDLLADDATDLSDQDEIYAYFSGQWGRVNLGQEDGAAYLLQVAAPSADSNVDGLRTYIQGFSDTSLDYAQDMGESAEKITYLTPKFSGFQAGVSYAPEVSDDPNTVGNGVAAMNGEENDADYEDLMEIAARWDYAFDGFGLSLGAGYGTASNETNAGAATDDMDQWNVGANLQWTAFEFGAAYLENNSEDTNVDTDSETWTVGLGWANGPYTAGATYYETDGDAANTDAERWTVGGTYNYGPGMTFRGAVAFGETEAASTDEDFTQVTLGTEVNF
jgi:hypothetical protein